MQQILPSNRFDARPAPPSYSATVQDQLDRLQPPLNRGNSSGFVVDSQYRTPSPGLTRPQSEYPHPPSATAPPPDLLSVPGTAGAHAGPSLLQRGRGFSKVWKRNHDPLAAGLPSSAGSGSNGKRKESSEEDKVSIAPSLGSTAGLVRRLRTNFLSGWSRRLTRQLFPQAVDFTPSNTYVQVALVHGGDHRILFATPELARLVGMLNLRRPQW